MEQTEYPIYSCALPSRPTLGTNWSLQIDIFTPLSGFSGEYSLFARENDRFILEF